MNCNMRTFGIVGVVLTLGAMGAGAAVSEQIAGYKTLTGCRVEFSTVRQADHLSATINNTTLLGGATDAVIPSVLMHSDEYGDVVVESIGADAFAECGTALRELNLPESVTNVAANAFASCSELEKVKLNGASPSGLAAAGIGSDVGLYYVRTPSESVAVPAGYTPANFAIALNDGTEKKSDCLKAPGGVTTTASYLSCFDAVTSGSEVRFVLNEAGSNAVDAASSSVGSAALSVALSDDSTLTVADPLPGFYYSLKQGGEVGNLLFNAEGDRNKLGGRDVIRFDLTKPDGAGFYQTIITPTEYSAP